MMKHFWQLSTHERFAVLLGSAWWLLFGILLLSWLSGVPLPPALESFYRLPERP